MTRSTERLPAHCRPVRSGSDLGKPFHSKRCFPRTESTNPFVQRRHAPLRRTQPQGKDRCYFSRNPSYAHRKPEARCEALIVSVSIVCIHAISLKPTME